MLFKFECFLLLALLFYFVPISGLDGDNISVARDSSDSSWYHGWEKYVNGITEYPGKTLLKAIDDMHLPSQKPTGSFRLPIQNVYYTPGAGTVVTGTVVAGSCWPGMYVTLAPSNIPAQVQSIQQHHESLDECSTGDIVGLSFGDTDSNGDDLDIRRGEVVSDSDSPASNCSSFTAQIIVTSHPGYIKSGYTPNVHCGTGRAPCRFEILDTMEVRTGRRIRRKEVKNAQGCDG